MKNHIEKINNFCTPLMPEGQKRFKLIACEIFYREICFLVSECENLIDVEFLRKGLHDIKTEKMLATIQKAIDSTEPDTYDAILLAYARCNNGIVGLYSKHYPLIIPRSHDCIGIFFGSCSRYIDFFNNYPGTYYRTSGWTERDYSPEDSVMNQLGLNMSKKDCIDKYGEDNAQYIMEAMGNSPKKYKYLTYIDMGMNIDKKYSELARKEASEKNLEFKKIQGSLSILKRLMDGNWSDKEFISLEPGYKLIADESDKIIAAEKQ